MNRQKQPRLLVSACLCGIACRYDGGHFDLPELRALVEQGEAVAFCPERAGGLPTPRTPCEICGDRVLSRDGQDCTEEYRRGAEAALPPVPEAAQKGWAVTEEQLRLRWQGRK